MSEVFIESIIRTLREEHIECADGIPPNAPEKPHVPPDYPHP